MELDEASAPVVGRSRAHSLREEAYEAAIRVRLTMSKEEPNPLRTNSSSPPYGRKKSIERALSSVCLKETLEVEVEQPGTCFDRLEELLKHQEILERKAAISSTKFVSFRSSLSRLARKDPRSAKLTVATTPPTEYQRTVPQESGDRVKFADVSLRLVAAVEGFIQSIYALFMSSHDITEVEETVTKIRENLKRGVDSFLGVSNDTNTSQILQSLEEAIDGMPITGTANTEMYQPLTTERSAVIRNVITFMKRHEQQKLLIIRSLVIQVIGAFSQRHALLFATITTTLLKRVGSILNNLSTIKELQTLLSCKEEEDRHTLESLVAEELEDNFWSQEQPLNIPEGAGTLNTLVATLTSPTNYENNYTKAFIMTYRSFTSPWRLLRKLRERFEDIPEDRPDAERAQIQLRTCIVLKYWMETRFFDFDDQLLVQLESFLKEVIAPVNEEMASRLMKTLESNIENFHQIFESESLITFTPQLVEKYFNRKVTQAALFMGFPASVIAEQLTIVDCEMFRNVEAVGFLNQSWIKPKLQYRALALVNFIERLDKYSFWTASLIVLQDTKATRLEMLRRIIEIAVELLDVHNNYHAVAGLVVGLNTAAVSRLKHTFAELGKKHKPMLDKLNEFMNPHGSYSVYRTTIRSKTLPVIPFIGVYLSDLTFIDEGNPDVVGEGFINFAKYDMIYKALREVLVFQQSRYTFDGHPLLRHYFSALPSLDEKALYNISLHLEPRNSEASQIL